MSKTQFQSNIKPLKTTPPTNAYTNIVKSTHACLVLHQHLGLVQNIVQTTQFLLGPKISVMIPDLFVAVTSKTLLNNQFQAIKKLKVKWVLGVVEGCLAELQKQHKKVILMAYSIGSAYAWKVLQKMPNRFQHAFLFYGTPNPTNFSPVSIKTPTTTFFGSDDSIKYLSDYQTYQQFSKKCKQNPNIKFEQINGVGHGFVNPDSQNFSEKAALYCQKIMFGYLPKELVTHADAGKIQGGKKEDCVVF